MRVKTGIVRRRRHKKILKLARGFFSGRRKHFRKAKEQLERSMVYAFRDRRQKKRDFRETPKRRALGINAFAVAACE